MILTQLNLMFGLLTLFLMSIHANSRAGRVLVHICLATIIVSQSFTYLSLVAACAVLPLTFLSLESAIRPAELNRVRFLCHLVVAVATYHLWPYSTLSLSMVFAVLFIGRRSWFECLCGVDIAFVVYLSYAQTLGFIPLVSTLLVFAVKLVLILYYRKLSRQPRFEFIQSYPLLRG